MYSLTAITVLVSLASQSLGAPTPSGITARKPALSGSGPTRSGDGSVAAGWPATSDWLAFDDLWTANVATIGASCTGGIQNSAAETANIKTGILSAASAYNVDSRYILATIMQESHGCVRVGTTALGNANPGLMQDHDGDYNCVGVAAGACTATEISGMINDGTGGTLYKSTGGNGLEQEIAKAATLGGASAAQDVYIAARLYNSGDSSYQAGDDLSNPPDATPAYCQDIANRLIGYVF
ncbi:hypothetical protein LARI1_G003573 [Lachnellula arida]|uniref:Transglycosylase SLT domain-containing protein n=1 Tax=Lachnellula arida TaxID=1316785 RepID=A0A8T9BHF6_9HELO|nr:hypothetical protein LARI1_G003573 [Lachnellula arida]